MGHHFRISVVDIKGKLDRNHLLETTPISHGNKGGYIWENPLMISATLITLSCPYRYDSILNLSADGGQVAQVLSIGGDEHLYDYIANPPTTSDDSPGMELTPCSAYGAPNVGVKRSRAEPPTD
jgi:hypothetical protein